MSLAHDERLRLVDTSSSAGPDAPTLCGEWTVRDLAAHLVVRERRPDASVGILLPPLAGYTQSVQDGVARRPFDRLLADVRSGPPIWSPFKLLDAVANIGEMFVHHEDVRRGRGVVEPRDLDRGLEKALWGLGGLMGRKAYRSSPVTVVWEAPEFGTRSFGSGSRRVVLRGPASELALHAFGRDAVALEFDGDEADVAAVKALDRSF